MKKYILIGILVCGHTIVLGQILNVKINGSTPNRKTEKEKPTNSNESNPSGNSKLGLPDMAFDPLKCKMNVTPGKNTFDLVVDFNLLNESKVEVSQGFHLGFYLSKSPSLQDTVKLLDDWAVPVDMCPDCEYTNYYSFNLAHSEFLPLDNGQYYMIMVLDEANNLKESNEDNNWLAIEKPIDYVVPAGALENQKLQAKKAEEDKLLLENAGKNIFGLGMYNYAAPPDNQKAEYSFREMIDTKGSVEFGEELTFTSIFEKPLKEVYADYRRQGLSGKSWGEGESWVTLVYEMIVDGQKIENSYQSKIISINATHQSEQITGKYSSDKFLSALYQLAQGDHTIRINTYLKSMASGQSEIGPTPVASGEFVIRVNVADKIAHFDKWSLLKPPAEMNNSTLSTQIKRLVCNYYFAEMDDLGGPISLSDIKHFAVLQSTWGTYKNEFGAILNRQIRFNVHIAFKNGTCGSYNFYAVEDYLGGGNYTEPRYIRYYTGGCMPCEAIK